MQHSLKGREMPGSIMAVTDSVGRKKVAVGFSQYCVSSHSVVFTVCYNDLLKKNLFNYKKKS